MKKSVIIVIMNFVCLQFSFGQCIDVQMYDICTPMGSAVSTRLNCEDDIEVRRERDDYYSSFFPDAEMIIVYDSVSSTRKFNCHGYAWIRVEQGIDRLMGRSNVGIYPDTYITDGSYIEVPVETYPGKVYWPGEHSAITTEEPGRVISKWGDGPLMKHLWYDSPYRTNVKYYVKAPITVVNFINQTVTTNTTVTNICGDINVQNVKVQNGAKLILDAAGEVIICSDFDVDLGSEFEIR